MPPDNPPQLTLAEAKAQFIQTWGVSGASWGVSKTLAQVHALLLVSPAALSTEDLMEQLSISRGNASMTVRDLLDWGLIYKELKPGERREYFVAEKDMLQVTRCIIRARKRRELDQMKRSLDQLAARQSAGCRLPDLSHRAERHSAARHQRRQSAHAHHAGRAQLVLGQIH